MSERRVEVRRLDAHFLDHVGVRRRGEAPIAAVVGRAVDRPFVPAHAAGRRRVARRAIDEPLRDIRHVGRRVDAGHEARQQHRHVREHRQALDAAPIEVLPGREDAGLEYRGLAADGDGLADGADPQRQVDAGLLRDRQDDAAPNGRLEALQLGAHTVVPRQQQRRLVVAGRVGRQGRRHVRVDVGDRHGDAGHRAALLVEHMADDRAARLLRECRDGEGEHQSEHTAAYARNHVRPPEAGKVPAVRAEFGPDGRPALRPRSADLLGRLRAVQILQRQTGAMPPPMSSTQ